MIKFIAKTLLIMGVAIFPAWADEAPLVLDTVRFQLSAKDWVSTDKALLAVNIAMTLDGGDMVQARADILKNLQKIAKGDWHITRFNRSRDSSDLEKLAVSAQARVAQSELTDVYESTKKVSKPGAAYSVNKIDFTPDLQEQQAVQNKLRGRLYQKIQAEIEQLNASTPEQHYTVNQIVFVDGQPGSVNRNRGAAEVSTMTMAAPSISVSNETYMTAVVELASNRNLPGDKKDD